MKNLQLFENGVPALLPQMVIFNKEKLSQKLSELEEYNNLTSIKKEVIKLKEIVTNPKNDKNGYLNIETNGGDTIKVRKDIFLKELNQIIETITLDRAKYYIKRLRKGIEKVKTNKINDINLLRWKEYDEIITDSLWILDKRDTVGAHLGWYWGNFVPQIPRQMMLRYTKRGDWVLDPFLGSGTTLIECKRLGRNGVGIELNSQVAQKAEALVNEEKNEFDVITKIIIGDSRKINIRSILNNLGITQFQLVIMHPPYHDIIKFSDDEHDLSNAKTITHFFSMFGEVVDNISPFLEKRRYLSLVIGDKYSKGEWIPLGFYCMEEVLKRDFTLKCIIVKNFEETRGKRNQKELWRYRALVGGFYVFKHEYIMLFQKS